MHLRPGTAVVALSPTRVSIGTDPFDRLELEALSPQEMSYLLQHSHAQHRPRRTTQALPSSTPTTPSTATLLERRIHLQRPIHLEPTRSSLYLLLQSFDPVVMKALLLCQASRDIAVECRDTRRLCAEVCTALNLPPANSHAQEICRSFLRANGMTRMQRLSVWDIAVGSTDRHFPTELFDASRKHRAPFLQIVHQEGHTLVGPLTCTHEEPCPMCCELDIHERLNYSLPIYRSIAPLPEVVLSPLRQHAVTQLIAQAFLSATEVSPHLQAQYSSFAPGVLWCVNDCGRITRLQVQRHPQCPLHGS